MSALEVGRAARPGAAIRATTGRRPQPLAASLRSNRPNHWGCRGRSPTCCCVTSRRRCRTSAASDAARFGSPMQARLRLGQKSGRRDGYRRTASPVTLCSYLNARPLLRSCVDQISIEHRTICSSPEPHRRSRQANIFRLAALSEPEAFP